MLKTEFTYEEVASFHEENEKLKGFEFVVEEILRDLLRDNEPKVDGIPYYERMGFLKEYERRNQI